MGLFGRGHAPRDRGGGGAAAGGNALGQFAVLLDSLPDAALCVGEGGRVLAFNGEAAKLWGYSLDDVRMSAPGTNPLEMLLPGVPSLVALSRLQGETVEMQSARKNGDTLHLRITVSSAIEEIPGLGKVCTVVARPLAAPEKVPSSTGSNGSQPGTPPGGAAHWGLLSRLSRSPSVKVNDEEERIRQMRADAINDTAVHAIMTCDPDGQITMINRSAPLNYRYNPQVMIRMNVFDLMLLGPGLVDGEPSPGEWMERFLKSIDGDRIEVTGIRGDGEQFPADIGVRAVENRVKRGRGKFYSVIIRDLTSDKAAQLEIAKQQRRLRAVTDSSVTAMLTCDMDGGVELFNKSAADIFEYEEDAAKLGLMLGELIVPPDEDEPGMSVGSDWAPDFLPGQAGVRRGKEVTGRRCDGTEFPLWMCLSKVVDEDGDFYTIIMRDITEEKAANQAARRAEAINDTAVHAIMTCDPDGQLTMLNRSSSRNFRYDAEDMIKMNLADLIVPDEREGPACAGEWMRDYLRMRAGSGYALHGKRGDGEVFPVGMAVSACNDGAKGGRFYSVILRDLTDERAAQHKIESQQRRTRAITDSAINAILTCDQKGRIELFNKSAAHMFDYSEEAAENGLEIGELIVSPREGDPGDSTGSDWAQEFLPGFAGLRKGREVIGRRCDGSEFPVWVCLSKVEDEDGRFYTLIMHDVTEEKAANKAARRAQAINDSAVHAIMTCDPDGQLTMLNRSSPRNFRIEDEKLLAMNLASLIVPGKGDGGPAKPGAWMRSFLARTRGTSFAIEGRMGDGTIFPAGMSVSAVDDSDDGRFYAVIMRNVTEEKAAEARVAFAHRRTRAIMDSAINAILTLDQDGNVEMSNKSACKVFGFSEEEIKSMNLAQLLLSDPMDASFNPQAGKWMRKFLKERSGSMHLLDGQRAGGEPFPMRVSVSEVPFDESDPVHLFTAILRDITSEKEAEERDLQNQRWIAAERSRLSAILDATVDGIIVTNEYGVINTFNAAAEKIFGWTASDVLGTRINDTLWSTTTTPDRAARWGEPEVMGRGREVDAARKDGAVFLCYLSTSVVTLGDGSVAVTGTVRDLTNEQLLMNMLPPSIAARIKDLEWPIHDKFDAVTILFADVVGFTAMSSMLEPMEVVSFLDDVFRMFDDLADLYGLEKIKTIGDCYMVVGGLPIPHEDHARRVACFALDMVRTLQKYNESGRSKHPLDMRVGIHTGPVVAGVVGKTKYLYDLWGDAVNVASRMESSGEPGRIQCSKDTVDHLADYFSFTERGEIPVKGKGTMHTWWLDGPRRDRRAELLALIYDQQDNFEGEVAASPPSASEDGGRPLSYLLDPPEVFSWPLDRPPPLRRSTSSAGRGGLMPVDSKSSPLAVVAAAKHAIKMAAKEGVVGGVVGESEAADASSARNTREVRPSRLDPLGGGASSAGSSVEQMVPPDQTKRAGGSREGPGPPHLSTNPRRTGNGVAGGDAASPSGSPSRQQVLPKKGSSIFRKNVSKTEKPKPSASASMLSTPSPRAVPEVTAPPASTSNYEIETGPSDDHPSASAPMHGMVQPHMQRGRGKAGSLLGGGLVKMIKMPLAQEPEGNKGRMKGAPHNRQPTFMRKSPPAGQSAAGGSERGGRKQSKGNTPRVGPYFEDVINSVWDDAALEERRLHQAGAPTLRAHTDN